MRKIGTSKFDLQKYNANITDYLGVTTFWTVLQSEKVHGDAEAMLVANGIDGAWLPAVTQKTAFKRAGDEIGNVKADGKARFVRKIVDDAQKTVIGIVRESISRSKEKLSYKQEVTCTLNKESGKVSVEATKEQEDIAQEFVQKFERLKKVVTDYDIRAMIRDVIGTLNGVALRETGGFYFIPRDKVETIVKLDKFLRGLGVGKMYILHMQDSEVSREVAWESLEEEMEKRIEKILEAVDKIEERAACLDNQEEKLAEAKKVMEEYAKLTECETQAEAIRERFEEAEKKIAEKIATMQKA